MLIVLIVSYISGLLIEKYQSRKKSKLFLAIGIIIIISQLVYLKYSNLFITPINSFFDLLGFRYQINVEISNPLIGISYYSLIMISYLLDIYRGVHKAQKNILKCALFMTYFPILISGPFIKYDNIEYSLYEGNNFNYENMCKGLIRILWGIFKILIISQRLSFYIDNTYNNLATFNGIYIMFAILFFPLQLYANFSGSIDITMGVSKILGIDLPENFNTPFFSESITQFWKKWHITLGEWLKNYVFYPLLKSSFMQKLNNLCQIKFGKKIGKKIPLYMSMLVMWFLIGVWHGGKMTFIIGSGILQFLFMFLEDILKSISDNLMPKIGIRKDVFSYKLYRIIRTYLLFAISMVFFKSSSVEHAIEIFKNLFIWNPWVLFDNTSIYSVGLDLLEFRILIIGVIILFVVELLSIKGKVIDMLLKQNLPFRWLVIYALLFFIIIYGWYGPGYDPTDFIYAGF